jgi:hypothetical protein
MPYLVTTSIYPSEKVNEVAAKYLEVLEKFPHDDSLGTTFLPASAISTHQGIKGLGISEILDGKLDVAFNRDASMMAMFNDISGFEYTIEVYMKVDEAMAAIGMTMP